MTSKRYNRQILLEQVGVEGQARLAAARILCIGAGGLGAPALLYLAGAGIGTLGIVDDDVVDESNLHRQIIFTADDVGTCKVEAAARRVTALNPTCNVIPYRVRLSAQNAIELIKEYDIIIDGSDNFATKYLINDACYKLSKPFIFGSALGFEARVAAFAPDAERPCYRCLYPSPPKTYVANCAEAGVLGPVVGMAGTYQATEALKYLLTPRSTAPVFADLCQTLWVMDALYGETHILGIAKDTTCTTCGRERADVVLEDATVSCMREDVFLTLQEIENRADIQLIDVREADEFEAMHLPSAINYPLSRLREHGVHNILIQKEKKIVLYCQRGARSREGAALFEQSGQEVYQLRGGLDAYR